jgi:autotransporter-associated beta strand protein
MTNRKLSGHALMATLGAVAVCHELSSRALADTTWSNAGSSWFNAANWNGGVPSSSSSAIFPAAASVVTPNVGANTATARGISITNGAASYSIGPAITNGVTSGTLTLGAGSFLNTGGGTTSLNVDLRITAPTSFTVNTNTRTILAGHFYGGNATNSVTKEGAGTFQIDQGSSDFISTGVTINGGVLEVRNELALGIAPTVTVNSGAVFQLDPALRYVGGSPTTDSMFFGDGNNTTVLNNGATLRNGASPSQVLFDVALYGKVKVQNGGNVNLVVPTNGALALVQSLQNTAAAPGGTGSVVNVTGAGIVTLNGHSGTSVSYTGGWNINHGIAGGVTGLTFINDYDALGVSNTGTAAPVTLTSGFLSDVNSDISQPVPNPMTFNGGVLNAIAVNVNGTRSDAYFSGAMNISSLGGSTIDMSSTNIADLSGPVCNMTLSGPVSGAGLLFITAPTTNPASPGVVTLSNTSLATPNSQSGNLVVQWNAALAATTSSSGSDPLGSATISLAGGQLQLNHAGAGSGGTINPFANNSIVVKGYLNSDLPASPTSGGTIVLGNASSANTGNTIALNTLTFDSFGTSADQALAIQNSVGGVNYSARFNGTVTLTGNATITTGANPADVIFNNRVTGSGNLIKAGNNTLTMNGVSSDYSGSTTVNGGTLVFGATHRIGTVTINSGARAVVSSGGNKFLKAGTLTINGTGTLDMTDEDAMLTNTVLATVRSLIQAGYNGGAWNGNGITSSQAASVAANAGILNKTALGYGTATQTGKVSFDGEPVSGSDVLIRYTLYGDLNLDGTVNSSDFSTLASNFHPFVSGVTWAQGDFNYDGRINALDFNLLATNFGLTQPSPAIGSAALGSVVPEPGFGMFIFVGFSASLIRRRRGR